MPPMIDSVVHIAFTLAFVGGFGIGVTVGNKLHLAAATVAIEMFRRYFVPLPFEFAYANFWIYTIGM